MDQCQRGFQHDVLSFSISWQEERHWKIFTISLRILTFKKEYENQLFCEWIFSQISISVIEIGWHQIDLACFRQNISSSFWDTETVFQHNFKLGRLLLIWPLHLRGFSVLGPLYGWHGFQYTVAGLYLFLWKWNEPFFYWKKRQHLCDDQSTIYGHELKQISHRI